jgi:ParB family transcriptional regulator, chromosome partitioning protein
MQQKSVLGKGLSSLIPAGTHGFHSQQVVDLPIDEICLNPAQPRKKIEEERIRELAESIKVHGLLQPVIVTKKEGLYHLVVGERRLRAARSLGMKQIPVLVKEYAWDEMLKVALVENLQREDLSPVEEAKAYDLLIKEHNLTQEGVAEAIGRSRPYVANIIRLLNLPRDIIEDLESGVLSTGHARALLGLESELLMLRAASKIKRQDLSVRQTEDLIREMKDQERPEKSKRIELHPIIVKLQDRLSERFSTRVAIKNSKGQKGRIEIHYNSNEELERIISTLGADEEWM